MEFKVGDKVRKKFGDGREGTIVHVDSLAPYPYWVDYNGGYYVALHDDDLELAKTDLRDLLKVGYKVDLKYDNGIIAKGYDVNDSMLYALKRDFDCYLNNNKLGDKITSIYKPKYNGVKPMEWELVWERKEPKYYLRSWADGRGSILEDAYNYLNFNINTKTLLLSDDIEGDTFQTQFTEEEIEKLPNQEFIKTLVKEKVE